MVEIGVRELKRDLSGYVKRAAAGESIRVTVRGAPVVDLVAAPTNDEAAASGAYQQMVSSGLITPATKVKGKIEAVDLGLARSPFDLLMRDREARR